MPRLAPEIMATAGFRLRRHLKPSRSGGRGHPADVALVDLAKDAQQGVLLLVGQDREEVVGLPARDLADLSRQGWPLAVR